jgi:S1-C subfamily serine protease
MKKLIPLCLSLICAILQAPYAQAEELFTPIPDAFGYDSYSQKRDATLKPSMVLVLVVNDSKGEHHQGSGFIVGDGYVMTSGKLLSELPEKDKGRVLVTSEFLPVTEAKVKSYQCQACKGDLRGEDLGLLQFPPPGNTVLTPLVFSLALEKMDEVYAWGFPQTYSDDEDPYACVENDSCQEAPSILRNVGNVSSLFEQRKRGGSSDKNSQTISHLAPMEKGLYGGPLVNYSGQVVGMNVDKIRDDDDVLVAFNLAVPSSVIVEFLSSNGVTPLLAEGQTFLSAENDTPQSDPAPKTPKNTQPSKTPKKTKGQTEPYTAEASTRIRDLGSFKVEVPDSWNVLVQDKDSIFLTTENGKSSIGLLVAENQGKNMRDIAEIYAAAADGSDVQKDSDMEIYTFHFNSDGKEAIGFVFRYPSQKNKHFVIYVAGDYTDPGVNQVLDSIYKYND